ncbi:KAP family NTPase [Streptomyces sp. NBC_01476]|uniref:KAP family P-loop NTPase fold protein n=1 Tax=Streptomyces sp. NBC_01476 TaxID=2903881 RepID=UPI002E36B83F|nr:P-loop NTPase fold protein [Streptomyces sp. NBC_01476]
MDSGLDRLGRGEFALRLARTLAERSSDHGYVVGLYGQWGEGKTTVLNFVRTGLGEYPADQVTVVEFNPWFDSDETHLYAEFLHSVASAVGVRLERRRETVIRHARSAQGFVGSVPLPSSVNSIVKVSELLGTVGGLGQPTLRDFHDRLGEIFGSSGSPVSLRRVVVLMDDIDRLDNAQIAAVFRMVKLAADFSNLSFVLAFDQNVVAEALGARYRSGGVGAGQEFLEKIINAPLYLPRTDPSAVAQALRELLEQVLSSHGISLLDPGERIRLHDALDETVWPCVTSLRQGKRLLGKIDFALPIMMGEVNPVDQVLMESLQLFFPSLYSFVAANKPLLVSGQIGEQEQTDLRQKLDDVCQPIRQEALELLKRLFPQTQAVYGNRRFAADEQEQWVRARRVCAPSYFDRYFAYGLPSGDVLDSEITAVIQAAPPRNAALLRDLLNNHHPGLVVEKLVESALHIPPDAVLRLPQALADSLGAATAEVLYRAGGLIRRLLAAVEPAAARLEAAQDLLNDAPVHLAAAVFAWLEAPHHDPEEGQPPLGFEETQRLGKQFVERVLALPPDQLIAPGGQTGLLAYMLCLRHEPERARQHLKAAIQADKNLLQHLLALFLNHRASYISALTRTGYQQLVGLLPAEVWLDLVRQHFPAAEATLAGLPQNVDGQPTLPIDSSDFPVLAFLAAFRTLDTQEPPTPAGVFEPTTEAPSQFLNYSPHHLAQPEREALTFVIRSAVVLPRQLTNGPGAATSTATDQTRIKILRSVADRVGLRGTLIQLLGTPPWQLSSFSDWTEEGGAGREAAKLLFASSDDATPGFSMTLQLETGRATPRGDAPREPGITAMLDLVLRLPNDERRLTLEELRDLLIDTLQLHRAMKLAATELLPFQPETGEGLLYLASSADLGQLIDMDAYGPSRRARNDIPLYYRLPLLPPHQPPFQFATTAPSPEAQLAIELIKRSLQWTGRRNFAPSLNQLLRTAPH